MTDTPIFICPVCEAVIEGDLPCPNWNLRPHPQPCPTCAGTGWLCDVHQVGGCVECPDFDGSLSGCPTCTPPGGCGGTGLA